MGRFTKETLSRANDLEEKEVDLPTIGGSVRVRALPAKYSAKVSSKAIKMVTDGKTGEQRSIVNLAESEALKVHYGLVEPALSLEEVEELSTHLGKAWQEIIKAIDDLSGTDEEAVEEKAAQFRSPERRSNGTPEETAVVGSDGDS
jgi:hypothetical protein